MLLVTSDSPVSLTPMAPLQLHQAAPELYDDLHRIAARLLSSERRSHTLQATALVNEAYLKLARGQQRQFADQVHFLAVASRVMRQVLVDHARARSAGKRDPEALQVTTLMIHGDSGPEPIDIIALDDALGGLAQFDSGLARLVEMRYFGGMTAEESAEALDISVHIVRHDLRFAEAWLRRWFHSCKQS